MRKYLLLISYVFFLSSCSTLHTGPLLLGDIPLPFGRMDKGEIYTDKGRRFQVSCPVNQSVVDKAKYGVTFTYMEGISNYQINAYGPEGVSKYEFTLDRILEGIKVMLKQSGVEINIERMEFGDYRGYQSVDFDFCIARKGNMPGRIYISRLVKTENFIYWIKYSNVSLFKDQEGILEARHFKEAEKFFDSIKFENEF